MSTPLDHLAWPAVPKGAVLLVPVGSTEQHGPHLPLGTDSEIASVVADRVADRAGGRADPPAVVAPPVTYGASGEHEQFPGTVSIGHEALTLLLVELGRSASRWAARLLLMNGHGGNVAGVRAAVRRLRDEGRDAAWVPCGLPGADAHAGSYETSVMLALAPRRVDLAAARPGACAPLAELLPRLQAHGVRAVSPTGVLGDPRAASEEAGRAALAAVVDDLAARLSAWDVDPDGRLRRVTR